MVKDAELTADVRRLHKELEEARLYNKLLNAMIDIAEDQMGIDIRKKRGAKPRSCWYPPPLNAMTVEESGKGRSLNVLCRLLGYTRQAYYKRKRSVESKALGAELVIQEVIRIRTTQKRVGVRKLHHMLEPFTREHEVDMGRDALYELLREHSMLVRRRRRRGPRTTFSAFWKQSYPNLAQGFTPSQSNHLWVSDITYIRVREGFAYLSLITDAYSRKIVGYHLNRDLSARGPSAALRMALRTNPERDGLIHHSDRGLQYYSSEYMKLIGKNIRVSMTERSDPLENAIAERVNGILKQELLAKSFASFTEAVRQVTQAVSIYNHLRPHLSIDMLTPAEAHARSGPLTKRWKNYYSANNFLSQAEA